MVLSYKSTLFNKINIASIILLSLTISVTGDTMSAPKLYSCSFEVFGRVQGVFFRKYTEKQANLLGIRGWCMNTSSGTVKGELEGTLEPLNEMKIWLKTQGSPSSRIEKVEFTPNTEIDNYSFNRFSVRR